MLRQRSVATAALLLMIPLALGGEAEMVRVYGQGQFSIQGGLGPMEFLGNVGKPCNQLEFARMPSTSATCPNQTDSQPVSTTQ